MPRVHFLFLSVNWGCFVSLVIVLIGGGAGDECCLDEVFSVSPWFDFCLRSESSLSSCWTLSSKVLLFSVSVCRLIDFEDLFRRAWFLFSFDLLLTVISSFSDKVRFSEDDPLWKIVSLWFRFRFVLLVFLRITYVRRFLLLCILFFLKKGLSGFGFCFVLNLR